MHNNNPSTDDPLLQDNPLKCIFLIFFLHVLFSCEEEHDKRITS